MPQSLFYQTAVTAIDGVTTTAAFPQVSNVGALYIGGGKNALRRTLLSFDLYGAAAAGRPLAPADVITSAELLSRVDTVAGPGGFACTIDRISRADWDYLTANWLAYNGALPWTNAGGDVAAPTLPFASPALTGGFTIAGALPFVTDAIANRGGAVHLRLKQDNEAPGTSAYFVLTATFASSDRLRLRVTYEQQDPSPISEPSAPSSGIALPARPASASKRSAPDAPAAAARSKLPAGKSENSQNGPSLSIEERHRRHTDPTSNIQHLTSAPKSPTITAPAPISTKGTAPNANHPPHHPLPRPPGPA